VARALLEHETIPGAEVYRLIGLAGGTTNSQDPVAINFDGESAAESDSVESTNGDGTSDPTTEPEVDANETPDQVEPAEPVESASSKAD